MKFYIPEYQNFQPVLMHVFTMAKWFGIASYGGKRSQLWMLVLLIMLAIIEVAAIWKFIRIVLGIAEFTDGSRSLSARLSGAIFYGNSLLSLILSWRLLSSWKTVSVHWMRAENSAGLYFPPDEKLRTRVIMISVIVAVCACVEHMLSMISATGFDIDPEDYFEKYILSSHGFLLRPTDYSLWVGIPIFVVSKFATILWNFQDMLIIIISMGLTSRYNRINRYVAHLVRFEKKIKDIKKFGTDMYIQVHVWRKVREAYVKQAALVRMVDSKMGALLLLSCFNNLYFICLQLFFGINTEKGSIANAIYYFISLGWLLVRACSVVIAASDVNVHSKRALPSLYECPSSAYNIEIKRLKHQLTNDFVALSGMGFYFLDRRMMLEVAASIIRYELVLIEYDG